jgi:hypothetical protein
MTPRWSPSRPVGGEKTAPDSVAVPGSFSCWDGFGRTWTVNGSTSALVMKTTLGGSADLQNVRWSMANGGQRPDRAAGFGDAPRAAAKRPLFFLFNMRSYDAKNRINFYTRNKINRKR